MGAAVGRDLRLGEVASFRRRGAVVLLCVALRHCEESLPRTKRGSNPDYIACLCSSLAGVFVLADFTPAESPCPL